MDSKTTEDTKKTQPTKNPNDALLNARLQIAAATIPIKETPMDMNDIERKLFIAILFM